MSVYMIFRYYFVLYSFKGPVNFVGFWKRCIIQIWNRTSNSLF